MGFVPLRGDSEGGNVSAGKLHPQQDVSAHRRLKTGKEAIIDEFSRIAERLLEKESLEEWREKVEGRKWRFYRYGYVTGRILDLGCGGGLDLLALHEVTGGRAELYGVDITDRVLELAERRARTLGIEGIHLLKGDIAALPFDDDFFDMVTVAWVLHHAGQGELDRIFDEIKRVLKPGGTFLMLEPCEPPATEEQWLWLELMRLRSELELLTGRDFPRIHFTPRFVKEYLRGKGFDLEVLEVIIPYIGGSPAKAGFLEKELGEIGELLSALPEGLRGHFRGKLEFILKKIEMIGVGRESCLIVKASLVGRDEGEGETAA